MSQTLLVAKVTEFPHGYLMLRYTPKILAVTKRFTLVIFALVA
jgi:hypothetical protein